MMVSRLMLGKRFLLLLGFMATTAYATSQPADNNPVFIKSTPSFLSHLPSLHDLRHGYTVVQLGGYWGTAGEEQNLNIRYLLGNHYTLTSKTSSNGLFGLGYYVNGLDRDGFHLDYGINGFFLANTRVGGQIVQEQRFTNLNYRYAIQHIPVFFAAKALLKHQSNQYNITFDAGIGPNVMKVNQYQEKPLNDFTIPDNGFSSHTQATFAAMAGLGVRINHVFGEAPLECGYRFFYLGQGQLQRNNNQLLNTLKTGSAFGNALLCSITV